MKNTEKECGPLARRSLAFPGSVPAALSVAGTTFATGVEGK